MIDKSKYSEEEKYIFDTKYYMVSIGNSLIGEVFTLIINTDDGKWKCNNTNLPINVDDTHDTYEECVQNWLSLVEMHYRLYSVYLFDDEE